MSDIVRSAIRAQMTEFPLAWRKDENECWIANAKNAVKCAAWPTRRIWTWEVRMANGSLVCGGRAPTRREAMNAAESAARDQFPAPTDVQLVTGWLALRSEVPDDVLCAALRLADRDNAERKAKKPDPFQGGGG